MQRAGTLTDSAVPCRGIEVDPVLLPPPIDELLHLPGHLDLGRPLARPLRGTLVGRVDPDLAAVELERRRVVEVIQRPLRYQDVALGIDVRPHPEDDLLV